jgi:hypothetical protein
VAAPYTERSTSRPNATTAVAVAGGVTAVAMLEALFYARRSQRGASIVARRPAASGGLGLRVHPTRDGRGVAIGVAF